MNNDMEARLMAINQRIKAARKQARLSQQQLADQVGVSDKAISAYEVGRSSPPLRVLLRIAQVTGLRIGDLVIDDSDQITLPMVLQKLEDVEQDLDWLRTRLEKLGEK